MKHKPLYMVHDNCGGEQSAEWLELSDEDYQGTSRLARDEEVTLEAMADVLDHDAENINAHDFVGAHRGLAALLHREIGRAGATEILRFLCDLRGLHGMLGVCGRTDVGDAEKALGVVLSHSAPWRLQP